jgi:hypothetical protein
VVGQISATLYSVMTHCLRRAAVEESLLHCAPQQQRSASAPFGNRSSSAELQSSLALVHHMGTTAVLQTLETVFVCDYFGDHCCITDIEQRSASASFGKHSLEILEVKKIYSVIFNKSEAPCLPI